MRKTTLVAVGLCAVLAAVTIAVPAMGGPNVLQIAKKARKTAKKANKKATTARRVAVAALARGGPTGPRGPQGERGEAGASAFSGTLPPGQTLQGGWGIGGPTTAEMEVASDAIAFQIPLAEDVEVEIVEETAEPTANCPGSPAQPAAAAGWLCIYVGFQNLNDVTHDWYGLQNGMDATRFGVQLYASLGEPAKWESSGTYAVTAP